MSKMEQVPMSNPTRIIRSALFVRSRMTPVPKQTTWRGPNNRNAIPVSIGVELNYLGKYDQNYNIASHIIRYSRYDGVDSNRSSKSSI